MDGTSALHKAAMYGHSAVIDPLVRAGITLDVLDGRGRTPLMLACMNGEAEAVKRLLTLGASLVATDTRLGRSAVHFAVMGRSADVVRLIVHAADKGAKRDDGTRHKRAAYEAGAKATLLAWKSVADKRGLDVLAIAHNELEDGGEMAALLETLAEEGAAEAARAVARQEVLAAEKAAADKAASEKAAAEKAARIARKAELEEERESKERQAREKIEAAKAAKRAQAQDAAGVMAGGQSAARVSRVSTASPTKSRTSSVATRFAAKLRPPPAVTEGGEGGGGSSSFLKRLSRTSRRGDDDGAAAPAGSSFGASFRRSFRRGSRQADEGRSSVLETAAREGPRESTASFRRLKKSTMGKAVGRALFGRSFTRATPKASRAHMKEKELRAAFHVFDADGSGGLSAEELKAVLTRPGGGAALTDEEVGKIIEEFDTNQDGELSYEEFAVFWAPEDDDAEEEEVAQVRQQV